MSIDREPAPTIPRERRSRRLLPVVGVIVVLGAIAGISFPDL